MGNEYVNVGWYATVAMTTFDCIAHEHGRAIKFYTLNRYGGVAKVVHIVGKTVDVGSIEAIVVVAANENFVFVG